MTGTAIVVDADGVMVDLVATESCTDRKGEAGHRVLFREMREGESLVFEDAWTAAGMTRAQWDGERWIETASEEEIAAERTRRGRALAAMSWEIGVEPAAFAAEVSIAKAPVAEDSAAERLARLEERVAALEKAAAKGRKRAAAEEAAE